MFYFKNKYAILKGNVTKINLLRGIYMTETEKFFEKMKSKKVAFIGIGVSNRDVIKMFAEKSIQTEARDKASRV